MDDDEELQRLEGVVQEEDELDELNDETFGDAVVDGSDWDKQQELLSRQSEYFEQLRVSSTRADKDEKEVTAASPPPQTGSPPPYTAAAAHGVVPGDRRVPGVMSLEELEARLNQPAGPHNSALTAEHGRQPAHTLSGPSLHLPMPPPPPMRQAMGPTMHINGPLEMYASRNVAGFAHSPYTQPAYQRFHAQHLQMGTTAPYGQHPGSRPGPGYGPPLPSRYEGGTMHRQSFNDDRCPQVVGNSYMTQDEVDVIIRQQSLQLNTANPFVDDYYYINFCASRLDEGYMRQVPVAMGAATSRGPIGKENVPPSQPAIWQTVLGRTQPFNIRAPRQLIQLCEDAPQATVGHVGSTRTATISAANADGVPSTPAQAMLDRQTPIKHEQPGLPQKTHHQRTRAALIARLSIENALLALGDVSDLTRNISNSPDAPFVVQFEQQRTDAVAKLFHYLHVEPSSCSEQEADEQKEILVTMMSMRKGKRLLAHSFPHLSQEQAFAMLSSVCQNCIPLLSASYSYPEESPEAELETETLALFMQAIIEAVGRQPLASLCSLLHKLLATYPVPSIFSHLLVLEAGMIFVDAILQAGNLLSTQSSGQTDDVARQSWQTESRRLADIILGKPDVPGISLAVFMTMHSGLVTHFLGSVSHSATQLQRVSLSQALQLSNNPELQALGAELLA